MCAVRHTLRRYLLRWTKATRKPDVLCLPPTGWRSESAFLRRLTEKRSLRSSSTVGGTRSRKHNVVAGAPSAALGTRAESYGKNPQPALLPSLIPRFGETVPVFQAFVVRWRLLVTNR